MPIILFQHEIQMLQKKQNDSAKTTCEPFSNVFPMVLATAIENDIRDDSLV